MELSRDLQDKVIIVTGGSRGIGFAIVQAKFGDTITTRATVNDIDDDRRELHIDARCTNQPASLP